MHFSSAFVLAIVGLAAAQSSTSAAPAAASSASSSGCGKAIDTIISACLGSTTPLLKQCGSQDWGCLCTQSQNVLTCYNNCPSDPNAFGAQQTKNSYCNAAKAYGSTSSTIATGKATGGATAAGAATSASSSSNTKTTQAVHSGFASGSNSASGSAAAATNAANGLTPAGGLVAAIFGLALL